MQSKKRIPEISSYEVILCFFVVMIHLLSESIVHYPKGTIAYALCFSVQRIITFAVPGFVMSAGIKFANKYNTEKFKYSSFLWGKRTIIIPYIFWAVVYYLYFAFYKKFYIFSFSNLFKIILDGSISAQFYFVIFMIQIYLLSPLFLFYCKRLNPLKGISIAAIITLVSVLVTQNVNKSNTFFTNYFLYWIIGYYIGTNFENIINNLKDKKILIICSALIIATVHTYISYRKFSYGFQSPVCEMVKVVFCAWLPVSFLIMIPKFINKFTKILAPTTFYIYLIHMLILIETQYILDRFVISSIPARFLITSIITYSASIIFSLIYKRLKKQFFKLKIK